MVWTRLVADLETPVSAMLKLAHERPNSFLLESVEGGAARGRYSIIGCEPDLIWRANGAEGASKPRAAVGPRGLRAVAAAHPCLAPRAARRIGDRVAAAAAAHGGGHLRLYGLRHRAAHRGFADGQARYARPAAQHPGAADADRDLRHGEGRDDGGDAGQARARRRRQGGLRARRRPAEPRARSARPAPAPCRRSRHGSGASGTRRALQS